MSVILEIQDGNPWYLSPDIWVVPGDDPNGPPGLPVAGLPAFIWARVHNNGTTPVSNATVRFYWANPSVGFDRNTANLVGTSFVTLNANDVQEVLCLTPWVPVFLNGGHECVLAEAFCAQDPLPAGPAFNVPSDRHVAQRNLSVVLAAKGMFHFAFEVHNAGRTEGVFTIRAEIGEFATLKPLAPTLGKEFRLPAGRGEVQKLGLVHNLCPSEDEMQNAKAEQRVELPGNARGGLAVVGRLTSEAALIHVRQFAGEREVGGLSVLVLQDGQKGRK